jgi:GNAT superfamily N-acetyltransferase
MALYLGPPGDLGRVRSRDGRLEVRQARTVAELGDFARINAENWTPPDADVELFYARSAAELLAPECPQRFFVAYRDGEALAAVEVTLAAGVAGVYNLSTRSSHRRRGIATVLLERTLWNAAESGVLTAVLQAAAAGVGLYRRLGFREFGVITELKSGQIQSVR